MTMNSPESLLILHQLATASEEANAGGTSLSATEAAEMMREVGLKCISFNGVCLTVTSSPDK